MGLVGSIGSLGSIGSTCSTGFNRFNWVQPGSTGFNGFQLGFNWVSTGFNWVSTGFQLGSTGFQLGSTGFTWFKWFIWVIRLVQLVRVFNCPQQHYTTIVRPRSVSPCVVLHASTNHTHKSWRSMVASHGRVPVKTHSTPVLPSGRRLWVAHRPSTTSTTNEPTTTSHKR